MKILRSISIPATLLAVGAAAVPAAAQTTQWDAYGDWGTTSNPNGAWAYGYSHTLGTFTPFSGYYSTCPNNAGAGVDCWAGGQGVDANNDVGAAMHVHDGVSYGQAQPGYLGMLSNNDTGFGVVRWTAPTTGTYNILGAFQQTGDDPPMFEYVLQNSVPIFTWPAQVNGTATAPFSFTNLALTAGTTIDFVQQDYAPSPFLYRGGVNNDEFRANITLTGSGPVTTTPEPVSMALLGTGLLVAGAVVVRRRRAATA